MTKNGIGQSGMHLTEELSMHTEGPWMFHGPRDNIHVCEERDPNMRVCFMTSTGPTVKRARLIAAAPDLLAAILNSDDAHWTPAMRAAVAKATEPRP